MHTSAIPGTSTHATTAVVVGPTPPKVIELSQRIDFNMHDAYYQHATADHFWIQWRFSVLRQLLKDRELGQHILEVGCGNGVVQNQFEKAFDRTIIGCDLNYLAMERGSSSRGQRYLYNVLDQRAEWNEHFDSVLLLDTLEHIDAPVAFLEAIANHLQPGGMLVINVPATPWLYSRYDRIQGHVRRYTTEQLKIELNAAGFDLERSNYWGSTVVPIAAIRKLLVRFAQDDEVLTRGFAPPSRFAESILRGLMRIESRGLKLPNLGTSLAAIARRK